MNSARVLLIIGVVAALCCLGHFAWDLLKALERAMTP